MPNTVIVTGAQAGPAIAAVSDNFTSVKRLEFLYEDNILRVVYGSHKVSDYELSSIVQVTYNIASGVATVTAAGT